MPDTHTISDAAKQRIEQFTHLHVGPHTLVCPYFNNNRTKVRAGLRVLTGKGSPEDIEGETILIAHRTHTDLAALTEHEARTFLTRHHLGIDCAAFVYYVLDALLVARTGKSLRSVLTFPYARGLHKMLTKLRPVENCNVKTLAHPTNSTEIAYADIKPGDMICILGTSGFAASDHVLLITEKTQDTLTYMHSTEWDTANTPHGIAHGTISYTGRSSILEETWRERTESGKDMHTYHRAATAQSVTIRRLNALISS